MMRINRMKKITSKNIFAWMMCFTMVLSVVAIGNVSNATGVTEIPTTEMVEATTSEKTAEKTSEKTANTDANGMLGKNSDVGIEVTKSITGKAGKSVKVEFNLSSNDETNVKLKSVYPVIDNSFPFETSGDAYKIIKAGDDVEKQKKLSASFKMTARNDIQTGYHSVRFIGEYVKLEQDGTAQDYYVIKTINIYFTGDTPITDFNDKDTNDDVVEPEEPVDDVYDDGDSGDDSYNGGSETEAVAPKLIITGYDTVPEKIMAGEKFTITIHIQNTSKTTSVCNGKFLIGNEAGSFLPTSGSSAVFVESIPAGKTGDIKIEMKAGADLQQKNYSLVIKGDFDDGRGNNFTSSDSLTIPVYQEVSFAVAEVSMSPEILGVGSEAALMFTINNKSSVSVYNVNVSAKSDAVEAEQSYVGNIAGMSSAYATLNLVGVADNTETGTITVVISYEDSEGTVNTYEVPVTCTVSEEGGMLGGDGEFGMEGVYEDDWEEEEEEGFNFIPIILAIVGIVVVVVIVTVVIILVIRRKKRMAELLEAEDGEDDLYNENF